MIWNETKECMSRDEMLTLQSARLVKQVNRVYHNVEFYRKRMQSVGLDDLWRSDKPTPPGKGYQYVLRILAVGLGPPHRRLASQGVGNRATVADAD